MNGPPTSSNLDPGETVGSIADPGRDDAADPTQRGALAEPGGDGQVVGSESKGDLADEPRGTGSHRAAGKPDPMALPAIKRTADTITAAENQNGHLCRVSMLPPLSVAGCLYVECFG